MRKPTSSHQEMTATLGLAGGLAELKSAEALLELLVFYPETSWAFKDNLFPLQTVTAAHKTHIGAANPVTHISAPRV